MQVHGPHPLSPVFTGYKDWSLNRGRQEHQYLLPIKFHFYGLGKQHTPVWSLWESLWEPCKQVV